jgi:hypothetical protein
MSDRRVGNIYRTNTPAANCVGRDIKALAELHGLFGVYDLRKCAILNVPNCRVKKARAHGSVGVLVTTGYSRSKF